MLETLVVLLVILWVLGLGVHVGGTAIHLLLILAGIVILIRIIKGKKPLD